MKLVYSNRHDIAHAFFYTEYDGNTRHAGTISFCNGVYNSYYTTIGYIARPVKGAPVLLISDSNFSNTTAKHRGALVMACPYAVLKVPFEYGGKLSTANTDAAQAQNLEKVAARFDYLMRLEMEQRPTYTRKPDRERAQALLKHAEDFSNVLSVKIPTLAKYRAFVKKALNTENIKQAAKKAREQAAKKAQIHARKIAAFKKRLEKTPVLDSIKKYLFDFQYSNATPQEREEKDLFIDSFCVDSPSFVIIEGDEIKTSQYIREKIADVLPLLRMWKHKHNIIGLKLGAWTVLANNDKYVKIGCHNIPVANVQALADTLL